MTTHVTVHVARHDAKGGEQIIDLRVPFSERMTVLDALDYAYRHIDPTLAYQYGCRFRKCGMCSIMMNGKPGLACATFVEDQMYLAPLPTHRVLRDLAIDRCLPTHGPGHGESISPDS